MHSHLNRGRVRASYFDLCIAARRLEMVAQSPEDMLPSEREKIVAQAKLTRANANTVRELLTKPEQDQIMRDMARAIG